MLFNRTISPLNYHHLHSFWAVAREGNLTRAARRLRVAQSALSAQIRLLEDAMGVELFERKGRGLVLTEAGRLALSAAEVVFSTGDELARALQQGRSAQDVVRVGATATLSRNFQRSFVKPLLDQPGARVRLEAGSLPSLLARLAAAELDVVLANRHAPADAGAGLQSVRLARQPVSVVASRPLHGFRVPEDLGSWPLIVPGPDSELRHELDSLCAAAGIVPQVVAEIDDMAMIRLLVRDSDAVGLVPTVVVRDELRLGSVHELGVVPEIAEVFYAITAPRRFPHPLVAALLARSEAELLAP